MALESGKIDKTSNFYFRRTKVNHVFLLYLWRNLISQMSTSLVKLPNSLKKRLRTKKKTSLARFIDTKSKAYIF